MKFLSFVLASMMCFFAGASASAAPIVVTATQNQTISGQVFNFNFSGLDPSSGPGTLTIRARGDYTLGFPGIENLGVNVDSGLLTVTGIAPDNSTIITSFSFDDTEFERQITINAATLAAILANGSANIVVTLDGSVNAFSPTAFVTVSLAYDAVVPEPASMLAWGLIAGVGAVGYRLRKRKHVATV